MGARRAVGWADSWVHFGPLLKVSQLLFLFRQHLKSDISCIRFVSIKFILFSFNIILSFFSKVPFCVFFLAISGALTQRGAIQVLIPGLANQGCLT